MTNVSTVAGPSEDIRAFRARLGLKQHALASMLHVDQATVSRWERGLAPVDPHIQQMLAVVETSLGPDLRSSDLMAGMDLDAHWTWLLRFFRSFRNMSQQQLAETMGCSAETVSRWERGRCAPDLGAQLKLRDLILAPLDSDRVLKEIKARLEASAGLYSANWGNLVVATSRGIQRKRARHGYPSPVMTQVDRVHDGRFKDRDDKLLEAGLLRGDVLLSYSYITVSGNDRRMLINLPVTLESGSILDITVHLPLAHYPVELDGQINILPCDRAIV